MLEDQGLGERYFRGRHPLSWGGDGCFEELRRAIGLFRPLNSPGMRSGGSLCAAAFECGEKDVKGES